MSYDKYPYGIEFQKSVLALMMLDPRFLGEYYDTVVPSYFEDPNYQSLAGLILEIFKKHKERPTYAVLDAGIVDRCRKIQDAQIAKKSEDSLRALLHEICQFDLTSPKSVAEKVIKWAVQQECKRTILESIDSLKKDDSQVLDSLPMKFQKALRVGHSRRMGVEFYANAKNLHKLGDVQDIYNPSRRIATPLHTLNERNNGGPGPSELCVVQGEAKRGKSIWLVNTAVYASSNYNKKVVYFTNELMEQDVAYRMAARLCQMPIRDVIKQHPTYEQLIGVFCRPEFYCHIKYYPPGGASVDTIRSYLCRLEVVDGVRPDLIIIDEADRLALPGKVYDDSSYHRLGEVYVQLIQLASDFECPIWTASQANRSAYGTDQVTADKIAGSLQKVQLCSLLISINQNKTEAVDGRCRIYVDRSRRGFDNYSIPCIIDKERMTIYPEPDAPPAVDHPPGVVATEGDLESPKLPPGLLS